MATAKYLIKAIVRKKDYRNYMYVGTFLNNKITIPYIIIIGLIAGGFMNMQSKSFSIVRFILVWLLFSTLVAGALCFQIEVRIRSRIKTDKLGTFNIENVLKCYDNKIVIENKEIKSVSEITYAQYYKLVETKEYFYFYLSKHQASILNKSCIENVDEFKKFIISKFQGRYKYYNV